MKKIVAFPLGLLSLELVLVLVAERKKRQKKTNKHHEKSGTQCYYCYLCTHIIWDFLYLVLLTVQGSGAREGDVEYLVAFGTIVILPCGSRASNRIERALSS